MSTFELCQEALVAAANRFGDTPEHYRIQLTFAHDHFFASAHHRSKEKTYALGLGNRDLDIAIQNLIVSLGGT